MEVTPPVNQNPEIWQVEASGKVYETTFEELIQWISEGALLGQDKVKRGNLRWIEAGKVPTLLPFFNAKNNGTAPPVITISNPNPAPNTPIHSTQPQNFQNTISPNIHQTHSNNRIETIEEFTQTPEFQQFVALDKLNYCLMHEDAPAKYLCDGCGNLFCKACPKSYGEKVKFCPMCGGIINPIAELKQIADEQDLLEEALREGFGVRDFGRAIIYPFKFPVSLIFGAIIFAFCTIGQDATALGGRWFISAAIMSGMLANTLTFGITANVIENMLAGKMHLSFMPNFEDFSLWDDVIHPFFLSFGIYLVSFAGLILLVIVMFYFVAQSITSDAKTMQRTFVPEINENYDSAQRANDQTQFFKEAVKKNNENYARKMQSMEQTGTNSQDFQTPVTAEDEEKEFQKMNEMINQSRKKQLESTIGEPKESEVKGYKDYFEKIRTWALPFFVLAMGLTLWGLFYLPVAYIVAAYTRNFKSLFSLSVGMDTIKRLGSDYAKILLMGLILLITNAITQTVIHSLFSSFDLPRLGNIPAMAVGSLFTFYFSIVFSLVLGYAMFKNSHKFKMFGN